MQYKKILITGGAGFVGSNLAINFKNKYPESDILVLDNLKRRGSELNLPRFKQSDIKFFHGDVRSKSDFQEIGSIDLIIECSAEPSVLAGLNGETDYLIDTNLIGLINCLNHAKSCGADMIFLSTSRVYPYELLNQCQYTETAERFNFANKQEIAGVSKQGVTENFPLNGAKSLYGATKLAAELFIQEYIESFGLKIIINRFGCIAGPWQMGKVDQGVMSLWILKHYFKQELSYIGYGGTGKQVRDFIHIDDVFALLDQEISEIKSISGQVFNVGGGLENSVSLKQLTALCEKVTGNKIKIKSDPVDRPADLKVYISDNSLIEKTLNWQTKKTIEDIVLDTYEWIKNNKKLLSNVLT